MELEEILKGLELSGGIVITGNSRRVTNFLTAHNEAIKILKKINADGCVGCKHEDVSPHCTPCDKCKRNCPENCRFVSNEVQAKNKRNSILEEDRYRICPVCGKKYRVSKRNGAKTCSYECGFKLRSKTHPNTKDYTKICPICGKRFNAKRGGHFKNAVYCSRKCKDLSCSPVWEYNGESHRAIEWAEIVGINTHCLLHRKDLGWTIEEILTTPLGGKRNAKCKL